MTVYACTQLACIALRCLRQRACTSTGVARFDAVRPFGHALVSVCDQSILCLNSMLSGHGLFAWVLAVRTQSVSCTRPSMHAQSQARAPLHIPIVLLLAAPQTARAVTLNRSFAWSVWYLPAAVSCVMQFVMHVLRLAGLHGASRHSGMCQMNRLYPLSKRNTGSHAGVQFSRLVAAMISLIGIISATVAATMVRNASCRQSLTARHAYDVERPALSGNRCASL